MEIYKAAVIGCGRIGSEFDEDPKRKYVATHAGAYANNKRTKLVSVCDLDGSKLSKCKDRWQVPSVYKDYKSMLENEKIDVLSICTPPSTHWQILKESVKYPLKAIFCEKPISTNLDEAEQMVELCKKNHIILQIDHQRRFDSLHLDLRDIIRKKKFGEVQQVNFYYTAGINNTGSHMFDLFRFFFGDAESIEAYFSKNMSGKPDDPNLDGFLRFKNGLLITFQSCDVSKYLIFELNCLLEGARIVLKDSGFGVDFYKVTENQFFSGRKELHKEKTPLRVKYKRNFMVNGVTHLAECIQCKKESISSGVDGLRVLELIESAILSARNNGKKIYLSGGKTNG